MTEYELRTFFQVYDRDVIVQYLLRHKTVNGKYSILMSEPYDFSDASKFQFLFQVNMDYVNKNMTNKRIILECLNRTQLDDYTRTFLKPDQTGQDSGIISYTNNGTNDHYSWIMLLPMEVVILGKLLDDIYFNARLLGEIFQSIYTVYCNLDSKFSHYTHSNDSRDSICDNIRFMQRYGFKPETAIPLYR